MKPITAQSREGRLLLALRRGPHEPGELAEQFGNLSGLQGDLMRAGLVAYDGDTYRLTEAGRAACPSRNPLAAKPAIPEVFTTPKGETKLTRQQVLAAIVESGAAGISRAALVEKFAHRVERNAVDMHITAINRVLPPVIFKPSHGHLVAIEFVDAFNAQESAQKTASTAPALSKAEEAALASPATHDIHGVSLAVDHRDVEDLSAEGLAAQMRLIDGPSAVAAPGEKARYALLFESEFHETIEGAIADAFRDYELDSLKAAVIVACTPLGRIDVRPVFVPEAA